MLKQFDINEKYSIRNIFLHLAWFLLLLPFFPEMEIITVAGICVYDIYLLNVLIHRTIGRKNVVDAFFSWICILPLMGIMCVADWKYYFCSASNRNILLIISFVIAFCVSAIVMKLHWKGMKPIATFLLFILFTFSVFGQAMLFNDAFNLSKAMEIDCEVTDKYDYPDRGGVVDTYTITLEPTQNVPVGCNNCELTYFSVSKTLYEQINIGDTYNLKLHEGLFSIEYYDKLEILLCIEKQIGKNKTQL